MPGKKWPTSKPTPKLKQFMPKSRGTDELEAWCMDHGFDCREKVRWLKDCEKDPMLRTDPPRFTYRLGNWRMLTPSYETPCWTVQHWLGSDCDYFTDFPLSVPVKRIVAFMEVV